MQTIGQKGIELIKFFERNLRDSTYNKHNFAATPYKCSANKDTIGWGHVIKPTDNITPPITLAQAEALLISDIEWASDAVNKWVKISLNQNQFDALVCFVFNVGANAFKKSTLLLYLNQGRLDLVPAQMARWNKCDGKVLEGLTNRRIAEVLLWQTPNQTKGF